jgi:hypothetical protein
MTIIVRYYRTMNGSIASDGGKKQKVRAELKWENDGRGKTWIDDNTGKSLSTPNVGFDVNDVSAWRNFLETYVDIDGNPLPRYDNINNQPIVYNVWINGGGYGAMRTLFPETKDYAKSGRLGDLS